MKKFALLLLVTALWAASDSDAQAQVAYVTYYQPAPVYQPVTVYRPAPAFRPAPVYYSSYYAPAPAVVTSSAPVFQPITRTRYRPILGGTVTRTRVAPVYPTYYAPAPVVYAY